MKKSVLKQIIREEVAKVQKQKSKNTITENAVTDLFASIKTFGFKNAVLANAGPPLGTSYYNGFKSGAIFNTKRKDGKFIYSKDVSWYAPDKVPGLAKKLDAADLAYEQSFRRLKKIQQELAKKLGVFTDKSTLSRITPQEVAKHKDFLRANSDVLKAEKAKLIIQNEMEIALGGKAGQDIPMGMEVPIWGADGNLIGVSKEREDLYKIFPKHWVDDIFTDKPMPIDTRVDYLQEKIDEIERQINTGK